MFIVDKHRYERQDLRHIVEHVLDKAEWTYAEGKFIAVCTSHSAAVVGIVRFMREHRGSVLLLNGETPMGMAIELARNAGCHVLVYGDSLDCIPFHHVAHPDLPSVYQYSSGTTGDPKLLRRSWSDVDEEIQSYNRALRQLPRLQPIILVPVYHSYGLITGILASISREVTPIIIRDKNPKFALSIIRSYPNSVVYGVPFLLHILLLFPREAVRFHHVISSGAPISDRLLVQLQGRSDVLWQQYGCSEAGCISIGSMPKQSEDVGQPLDRLQITAGSGPDSPDEVSISIDGRQIQTRDLGYRCPDGSLHILGRMDDLINVCGMKVIPSEVEQIIARMPDVAEVVVHKTVHKTWGEAVKAWIVPRSPLSESEVKSWCIRHLPPYKVPHRIRFTEEIPKMKSGKVSRKLLQEQESV